MCWLTAAWLLASVQVLQGADCKTAKFSSRARLRGSFRDAAAPDTLGRLVGAYEVSSSSSTLTALSPWVDTSAMTVRLNSQALCCPRHQNRQLLPVPLAGDHG